MSDDFISRKAAMDKINDIAAEFLKDHTIQCDIAAGVAIDIKNDVIKTLPSADVVEVVRCKNCKKWFIGQTLHGNHPCTHWSSTEDWKYTGPNDFCRFGERWDS